MSRTVTIVTAENIAVTYQVAGIASRFAATLVDLILQLLLMLLITAIVNLFASLDGQSGIGISSFVTALGLVTIFLIIFAYAIFFEMLWGGRTPGKRLFGLRVIRSGGLSINLASSAIRNVLRFIDFGILPFSPAVVLYGLPALLCLFFSPTYQRIGDYAAGTLVIVEAGRSPFAAGRTLAQPTPNVASMMPWIRNLDRLSLQEYRVLRRFVARRSEMALASQAALGERLARPLMDRLEIPVQILFQLQFADVLEAIERRYAEERNLL